MKINLSQTGVSTRLAILSLIIIVSAWIVWLFISHIEGMSDRQRGAAFAAFQSGQYDEAIANVKLAMETAHLLPVSSEQVVEAYDDAGLYFFMQGDFRQSVRHQAIAVLFASENPELRTMLPVYVKRLGWAWGKYRPGSDFSFIKVNPQCLLNDSDLRLFDEPRIRKHFQRQFVPGCASRTL